VAAPPPHAYVRRDPETTVLHIVVREALPAHGSDSARTGLGTGVVRAKGACIDWASLLKRVFLEDVLACPCGGRRRILSDVQECAAVVALLEHLGLPTEPPPIAPAGDPTESTFGFG
jgi:hypothetical protein